MFQMKRVVLIVAIAVGLALVGIASFHRWFGTQEAAAMAAWVQAIGSIGVIIATAWIARIDFASERDHARTTERQLKESVSVLAVSCLDRLDYLHSNVRPGPASRGDFIAHYTPSDFEAPMDGLAAIPLHHLGDAQLIGAVLDLRREMGRIKAGLDDFKAGLADQVRAQVYDVQDLASRRTPVFNAVASIMRIVSPGAETDARLSQLAARSKGPLR